MAHSEICPVCKGKGIKGINKCHGCNGKGWIEVADGIYPLRPPDKVIPDKLKWI